MKKLVNLCVAASVCVAMTGCYGPFALTKKLHKWNGEMGNKWANEGVFLALSILPAYGFTAFADAVVLNSIEFWTGKNPVSAKQIRSTEDGNKQTVMSYLPATKKLRIDMFNSGRPEGTVVIEPGPNGAMTAKDTNGNLLTSATNPDGTVSISDTNGKVLWTYKTDEINKYLN